MLEPSSRKGATLVLAVASISAIIAGVANTSRVPLPNARAVFDSVTDTVLDPLIPMLSIPG